MEFATANISTHSKAKNISLLTWRDENKRDASFTRVPLTLTLLYALAGQALLFAGAQKVTKNALLPGGF